MDIARLGLQVDSSNVRAATNDLSRFGREGKTAAQSAQGLDGAGRKMSAGFSAATKAAGALAAAVGVGSALSKAISDARGFSAGIAEVSTLIEGTPQQMAALSDASKELASVFGTTATEQAQAFYQAISAGAAGVDEAATVLDAANRLAVGGVTSVTTGVDALTTAVNAYRSSGLTAAEASDAMFVGIKAGKTTADELSSALGKVVPIASSLGVGFDEIVASTAALTQQGVSTSEAVTGIRQAMSGILKPTKEAADEAERLGLNFSAEALADQGLVAFFEQITEKTGGNQESLSKLFGSVEALNSVMALTSTEGGAALAAIMDDMEAKAGATDAAYNKMAESMDNRLSVATAQMSTALLEIGEAVLPLLVPLVEAVASGVVEMVDAFERGTSSGIMETLASGILVLAENMDVAVPVFSAVAIGVAAISAPVVAVGVAIGALAVAVITHWDEIKAAWNAGVEATLQAGRDFLEWITPFAEMTPLGFLVSNVIKHWDEIKDAFQAGVDYVVGLGPRLVDALKEAADAALDAALDIGTEIINGIKAGIDNKWQEIKDRILSLGDSLPNWLRESLGIASPAREMIPIGEYAIDGVIVGIDNREDALRLKSEGIGEQIGKGIKDGLDPVLETIFDGLAQGDLGSIGSRILSMGQGSFSGLLQSSASGGGSFLGNVFGGLQNAWSGVTSSLSGIASGATGVLSGIGGAISSALPIVGAVSAVANLFKSTEVLVAEGVRVRMNETLAALDTYEKTKRENGFGLSSGFSRDFDEMDQAVQDALGARVAATLDNLSMLGLGNDLTGFEFSKRTEIKDGETLQGEMEEVIREALDAAVQYATEGALDGFAQTGETVSETLDRLAASLRGVNPVLDMMGQALLPVTLDGATAASALLELSGGLDAFSTNAVFVFDNFLTDAEQQARLSAVAMDQLNATFDDLNRAIPDSHAAFMDLLDAQDLTTEAGRNTYAALLDVAQAFVTVNGAAQSAASAVASSFDYAGEMRMVDSVFAARSQEANEALRAAENALRDAFRAEEERIRAAYQTQIDAAEASADAANAIAQAQAAERERLRQDRIQALTGQADGLSERVRLYRSIADALETAYTDRRVLSAIGQRMRLTEAQAFLRGAVGAGGTDDVERLEAALEAVENPSTALYSSFAEYQQDFNVNTNLIRDLRELNEDTLTTEERALDALELQIEVMRNTSIAQVESIQANTSAIIQSRDAQLSALGQQMNALLGIEQNLLSVEDATKNLQDAQQAVRDAVDAAEPSTPRTPDTQFSPGSIAAQINQIFLEELGRAATASGIEYYLGDYRAGQTLDQIRNSVNNSVEGQIFDQTGIPQYEGGGFTGYGSRSGGLDGRGGFMAMLHPNETVIDHTRQRRGGGSGNGDVVAELRALRASYDEANQRLRYMQDKLKTLARIANDQNTNGTPGTRDGAVVTTEAAT